jgi:hypothetical protein
MVTGMTTSTSPAQAGWVHSGGSAVCPRCNRFIPCDDDPASLAAAASGHDCLTDPGGGFYLRRPEAPAPGWYLREPDGTLIAVAPPIWSAGHRPVRS